jgi:hypothetical protein
MRKILLTLISFVGLSALVACGGGTSSNTPVPPPPSGGNNASFSNASLTGRYVFSVSGFNSNRNLSYTTVGVFTADGAGNISSGARDTVDDTGGQTLGESITGTYSVNQDGRGQAVLNGSSGQVIYRFVMQSPAFAKLFQISNTSDATGIFEIQSTMPSNAFQTVLTYIARFDGEDTGRNPYGAIGGLTIAGTSITGTIDQNDNGAFTAQLAATGSDTSPDANGRGTLTFTTSSGSHNFIYYWVSPSRIELVSTDKNFLIFGHADQQTSLAGIVGTFAGDEVLNISGSTSDGIVAETGRLTLASGNITNAIEDYNLGGVFFPAVTFTGTYEVAANGRWTANLVYPSSTFSLVGWQVSPSQSTVLATASSIANFSVLETGTLSKQTINLTNTSISGDYAEDLSGFLVPSGNVESLGNFLADGSGNLSGTIDSQTPFADNIDVPQSGLYSVPATNGRGSGSVGGVPVVLYTIDADTIDMISTDPNRIYQGKLEKQP